LCDARLVVCGPLTGANLKVAKLIELARHGLLGQGVRLRKLGYTLTPDVRQVKVQAAVHYAEVYAKEINEAIADNQATDFTALKNLLPQTVEFVPKKSASR